MKSNSKILQLAETLDQIGAILESHGERHWAKWLRGDAAQLRNNNFSGVTHFLGAFGGMGSINDIYICPTNGHRITEPEVGPLNRQICSKISEAWSLEEKGSVIHMDTF